MTSHAPGWPTAPCRKAPGPPHPQAFFPYSCRWGPPGHAADPVPAHRCADIADPVFSACICTLPHPMPDTHPAAAPAHGAPDSPDVRRPPPPRCRRHREHVPSAFHRSCSPVNRCPTARPRSRSGPAPGKCSARSPSLWRSPSAGWPLWQCRNLPPSPHRPHRRSCSGA